jgi:hypothetical protein
VTTGLKGEKKPVAIDKPMNAANRSDLISASINLMPRNQRISPADQSQVVNLPQHPFLHLLAEDICDPDHVSGFSVHGCACRKSNPAILVM